MLTTLESGLLVALGALLTWLTGTISSRTQWRREEQRRRTDTRAELYRDMFARTRRIERAQRLPPEQALPTADEVAESDQWAARVALFASPEVSDLWYQWLNVQIEHGRILRAGLTTDADRQRYLDQAGRLKAAHAALVRQMRMEIEGRT